MASNQTTTIDFEHCTLKTCSIHDSPYEYVPALPENSFYLFLFGISLIIHTWQAWKTRVYLFYTLITLGCLGEIVGYVGRIQSHFNVFNMNAFLTQIVCLTISPAFFSAAIYICLSRIVSTFGNQNIAMMSSRWYSIIFIIGDLVSLFFQSAGGGMASIASNNNKDATLGNNIMLVGLSLQVFFLTVFMVLAIEFAFRVKRNPSKVSATGTEVMKGKNFKIFLAGLTIATVCVYIRSVYRVAELAQGWEGYLISIQWYFMVFEGLMIVIATFALNIGHPGTRFSEGYARQYSENNEKAGEA